MQASGSLHAIKIDDIDKLRDWLRFPPAFSNHLVYYLLLIFPIGTLTTLVLYATAGGYNLLTIFRPYLFSIFSSRPFFKKIMRQVAVSTAVAKVLEQGARQLKQIEQRIL